MRTRCLSHFTTCNCGRRWDNLENWKLYQCTLKTVDRSVFSQIETYNLCGLTRTRNQEIRSASLSFSVSKHGHDLAQFRIRLDKLYVCVQNMQNEGHFLDGKEQVIPSKTAVLLRFNFTYIDDASGQFT